MSKRIRLSKQIIAIWQQSVQKDASSSTFWISTATAFALHLGIFYFSNHIESSSTRSNPQQQSVRVELRPSKTTPDANASAKASEQPTTQTPTPKKKRVLATDKPTGFSQPVEAQTPQPTELQPERQMDTKAQLPEERQSPILPSGKLDFIEKQRKLGEVLGAGAVAGDLEIPDVVSDFDKNSGIRTSEYTFAGYFNSLSRRFVEAWGGVRTLPPQARFDGKLGEFIEYDVVINRDGTLRKIVNITAKREPYRDFSAVDDLVGDVFRAMFPFQPVPERIKNDPLVVRKRIQFVGFKYTLY